MVNAPSPVLHAAAQAATADAVAHIFVGRLVTGPIDGRPGCGHHLMPIYASAIIGRHSLDKASGRGHAAPVSAEYHGVPKTDPALQAEFLQQRQSSDQGARA